MKLLYRPALILIDIQKAFEDEVYWGAERNNRNAEQNCRVLLDYWRINQLPLFHIKHCSADPNSPLAEGKPGNDIKDIVCPLEGEIVIKKSVNSAFIGTDLKDRLDKQQIEDVVIVGLTTDHCVSTTTRMAGNYGFKTFIISDATATFGKKGINDEYYSAEIMHLTALAQLKDEFATVLTTEQVIRLIEEKTYSHLN
jgi:nicotinamidase-related amidase